MIIFQLFVDNLPQKENLTKLVQLHITLHREDQFQYLVPPIHNNILLKWIQQHTITTQIITIIIMVTQKIHKGMVISKQTILRLHKMKNQQLTTLLKRTFNLWNFHNQRSLYFDLVTLAHILLGQLLTKKMKFLTRINTKTQKKRQLNNNNKTRMTMRVNNLMWNCQLRICKQRKQTSLMKPIHKFNSSERIFHLELPTDANFGRKIVNRKNENSRCICGSKNTRFLRQAELALQVWVLHPFGLLAFALVV
mmetsp:Transcript_14641/g.20397  ORF Transcript_14641/g.20397 Transcript_14641/m.20397 type:complete len:251 (-) Transcript_14641:2190-2942(-)